MTINERTARELVERVNERLREEQPGGYISRSHLAFDISDAERYGDKFVTTKIPSGSEFTLTFAEARAYIRFGF